MWTGMDSIREGLFDDHTTSGTHLRRIPGVHQDHTRASLFRFVLRDRDETGSRQHPRCFSPDKWFFCIFLILQILEYNRTVLVHHPAGSLVSKIEPSVGDPFMGRARRSLPSLLPFRGALLCFRKFPLLPSQGLSRRYGRIGDSRSSPRLERVAKDSRPTSIRPRYLSVAQVLDHTRPRNRHTHFSVAVRRIVESLNVTFNRTVEDDLHVSRSSRG